MDEKLIERAFRYLDNLRDRGAVNMWGATPYLARHLGVSDRHGGDAARLHLTWMDSFEKANTLDLAPRVTWAVGELAAAA